LETPDKSIFYPASAKTWFGSDLPTSLQTPLHYIGTLAVILACALFVGLILPGLAAYKSEVFFYETMRHRVEHQASNNLLAQLRAFNQHQALLKNQISHIDTFLLQTSGLDLKLDLPQLLTLRQAYFFELNSSKPPVSIQPFYQHIIMYFWPIMYSCLGFLIVCLKPHVLMDKSWLRGQSLPLLAVCIFMFNVSFIWLRNFGLQSIDQGRIVYAYSNYDVSPVSFLVQQFNFAIFSILLAILWQQLSAASILTRQGLTSHIVETGFDAVFNPNNLLRISRSFLEWQCSF
jgi:hypothetical protein